MDEQLQELRQLCEDYKATPAAPQAFDFGLLIPILSLVIPALIKDERLRDIALKILDILSQAFVTGEAAE